MGKPVRLSNPPADSPAPSELSPREIELLRRGGFVLEPKELGEENSFALTQRKYEALVRSCLTEEEAAARLDVTPGLIRIMLTEQPRSLYGFRHGSSWLIPEFQFDGPGLLAGIEKVVTRLDPDLHPLSVSNWFQTPNPDLPEDDHEERNLSPREWLQLGRPPAKAAALAANL